MLLDRPGVTVNEPKTIDRRNFLRLAGVTAGLAFAPTVLTRLPSAQAVEPLAFVDDYTTNVAANLTAQTNAAVRILSGMSELWQTGTAWNTGTVKNEKVLHASLRQAAAITAARTDAEAKKAFIYDRQHQSYAMITGLGPLADLYRSGAKAVTSITSAPDGTPATTIDDAVPAGAPAGSSLGAGSVDSDLGQVALLVNTLRGGFASGNPAKAAFQYPRPWRMNDDSEVVQTGTDALGYPVYESDVVVAAQLLRQRSLTPASDGGFASGHTNAFYLAGLALAYAVPERFQELLTRAAELADTRIIAGMHSPVDVIGGRILATALAAATLHDPQYAALKQAARQQALAYFQAQTGTDHLFDYAHAAGLDADPYADREANLEAAEPRLTYDLPQHGRHVEMTVPKGAEVLLETRLPYLSADQRREVLRTTALPSGYELLDGPEQWGRLNLLAAADGYATFATEVRVQLDAAAGGFGAADTWKHDIDGTGALVKLGTGALRLTGVNDYKGGTSVQGGVLTAGSSSALGRGDVEVLGGTLRLAPAAGGVRIQGNYDQAAGAVLDLTLRNDGVPTLTITGHSTLAGGATLVIHLDGASSFAVDHEVTVIDARRLRGTFSITADIEGYQVVPRYTETGLFVRLVAR